MHLAGRYIQQQPVQHHMKHVWLIVWVTREVVIAQMLAMWRFDTHLREMEFRDGQPPPECYWLLIQGSLAYEREERCWLGPDAGEVWTLSTQLKKLERREGEGATFLLLYHSKSGDDEVATAGRDECSRGGISSNTMQPLQISCCLVWPTFSSTDCLQKRLNDGTLWAGSRASRARRATEESKPIDPPDRGKTQAWKKYRKEGWRSCNMPWEV